MKILILEDDVNRQAQFRKRLFNCSVVITDDPKECISHLANSEWDALFLDHDLGGGVFRPSDENSGYAVARWLELNPARKPSSMFIHSLNPAGVENIQRCLPEAVKAPFCWQTLEISVGEE